MLRDLEMLNRTLTSTAEIAGIIKAQLSSGRAPNPDVLSVPPTAVKAWHQFLLCLLSWSTRDLNPTAKYASKCLALLKKAHREIMTNPAAQKLEELELVLPNSVLAFIAHRVTRDFCEEQPDIVDSYWQHFEQLVRSQSF
jgi:hypothetical protein